MMFIARHSFFELEVSQKGLAREGFSRAGLEKMRNSETVVSDLQPWWLRDSSPVTCNHVPPYFLNILPLRSLRGKRKKSLKVAVAVRNCEQGGQDGGGDLSAAARKSEGGMATDQGRSPLIDGGAQARLCPPHDSTIPATPTDVIPRSAPLRASRRIAAGSALRHSGSRLAHETAGGARTRHSLRHLLEEGQTNLQSSRETRREIAGARYSGRRAAASPESITTGHRWFKESRCPARKATTVTGAWIPGPRQEALPGMTTVGCSK
jgi:hypothetical protein